jgi:hypothetical protein
MSERRLVRLAAMIAVSVLLLSLNALADHGVGRAHINRAIQNAGQVDRPFANRLKTSQAELQPLFIVVPGILGSKLKKGKDFIWGNLNGVTRDALVLNDASPSEVIPEFLDRFSIRNLFHIDVYGTLRDDLRFTDSPRWYDEFPYDWRDDIRVSARHLHEHLLKTQEAMKNRDVIFIAHSMGGLVVRSWYDLYYRNENHRAEYGFLRQPQIIFLGVPQNGSAAALLRLIHGFGADGGAFGHITNHVLKGLNQAASTFPSVYQLLPFSDTDIEFRPIEGKESVLKDFLDPQIWRDCQWGQPPKGEERTFYEETLPARLESAKALRDLLLTQPMIPNVVCFYSDADDETPLMLTVRQHGKGECTVHVARRTFGDGSVPAEISLFEPRSPHAHTAVYRATTSHMALPNAAAFRNYIEEIRARVIVQTIVRADPDDNVIAAFRRAQVVFPIRLELSSLAEESTKQTVDLNRRILGAGRKSDHELAHDLYEMAGDAKDLSDNASQFYALSLAFEPDGPHAPFAANNLAHNLLEGDRWYAARAYLEHAQKHLAQVPAKEKKFLATLHQNTAIAYEKTADFCAAITYYERAGMKKYAKTLRERVVRSGVDAGCLDQSSVNTSLSTRANAFAGGRPMR